MRASAVSGYKGKQLFLRSQHRFLSSLRRRIDLRVQEVRKIIDILLSPHHRRHESPVWRIGLVLMKHGDEVANIAGVASLQQHRQRTIPLQRMA
jgi:hypothetical protein